MTYLQSAAGFVIGERNTWHTRADQAWGPSDVWSTGNSWETMYGSASSDAATWQARANDAWGPSDVWNSGESWEAAYNRVLPPASVLSQDVNIGPVGTTGTQALATVTCPRSGYYVLNGFLHCLTNGSNQWRVDIYVGGGAVATGPSEWLDGGRHYRQVMYRGLVSAGQAMQLYSVLLGGSAGSITADGTFYTTFIPVAGYPH